MIGDIHPKRKNQKGMFSLDISKNIDATAGYAKIAMNANAEAGREINLTTESIKDLSFVLGQSYSRGRFINTNIDESKDVGLLTNRVERFQFDQGAGRYYIRYIQVATR